MSEAPSRRRHSVSRLREPEMVDASIPTVLYLDADTLALRLDRGRLIEALARAFRAKPSAPPREHYTLDIAGARNATRSLLVMPAWGTGHQLGVKLVTVFPRNAHSGTPTVQAAYVLFDSETGTLRAILEGTELTRRRTGAASALATRHLARHDAHRLLMVGTGSLAPHLIQSHALVRPITSVRVWGRRLEAARALAATLAPMTCHIEAVEDLEAAVRWADIISCATLSTVPIVRGAWLQPGQHLDLVGSFAPHMHEADSEAMRRAAVYVDTRGGALTESGEVMRAIEAGVFTADDIRGDLTELSRFTVAGRRSPEEITLFKSVGCAIEDLAAAELAIGASPADAEDVSA